MKGAVVTTYRNEHREKYTVMLNEALEDPRLSWKAKGLLAYLLSRPDFWRPNRDHLATIGPDGIRAVRSGLQELETAGYLERRRVAKGDGTFTWDTRIYETPPSARNAPVEPSARYAPMDNAPSKQIRSSKEGTAVAGGDVRIDTPKPNKYAGQCVRCGEYVPTGEGRLVGRKPAHLEGKCLSVKERTKVHTDRGSGRWKRPS